MRLRPLFATLLSLLASTAFAALSLPRVLSDHMVLQSGQPVPVWGWTEPGRTVSVAFAGQEKSAVAAPSGRWLVTLDPLAVSAAPAELTVTATGPAAPETIRLADVLVGEVWLCSGQSNMDKPIGEQRGQKPVFNAPAEIAAADFPAIRLLKVRRARSSAPARDIESESGWTVCSPATIDAVKFSAAGYFFGRKLHRELGVPVGLIDSTWGGTRIELWIPPSAYAARPALADFAAFVAGPPSSDARIEGTPLATLYNAMIAPLAPFPLRGALWYQGESNLIENEDESRYAEKSAALIEGWRARWNTPLSFYYVQLAPHLYHVVRPAQIVSPESLPRFWAQQAAVQQLPRTGMIVTTDLVDDLHDIHPRNKLDVGERLARLALARDYARADVIDSGPVFTRADFAEGRAVLHFDHTHGGLVSTNQKDLSWFTVAGPEGRFYPATAVIEGETVIVSSPRVPRPARVRFAWDEAARPNLANTAGLPAAPFQTDAPSPR